MSKFIIFCILCISSLIVGVMFYLFNKSVPMNAFLTFHVEMVDDTGRSFLIGDDTEIDGYGLYSYILFGSPPSDATRERYLQTIKTYLDIIPEIEELEKHFPTNQLNITYMPVKQEAYTPQDVLDQYNYARARALLSKVQGNNRNGPYIISYRTPLSGLENTLSGKYLFQNLSTVHPQLVDLWVTEFMNQASKQHYWEEDTLRQFTMDLRNNIKVASEGLFAVNEAYAEFKDTVDDAIQLNP